jgi:hypothetical protein
MIVDSKDSSEKYKSLYSTLFGLGITYFLNHILKYWEFVKGPEGITWNDKILLFLLIQLYFFINYFRYLFGLRRFAELTGKGFVPQTEDWINSKSNLFITLFKNVIKLLIVNVGIFQLLLFFLISSKIVPEINPESIDSKNVYKYLDLNLVEIYRWFFMLDLTILILDLLAVIGFKYLDSKITPDERKEVKVWTTLNLIEIACCALALMVLRDKGNPDFTLAIFFAFVKLTLLLLELLGGYDFWQLIKHKLSNASNK